MSRNKVLEGIEGNDLTCQRVLVSFRLSEAKFLKREGRKRREEAETSKTFRSFTRNAFCSGAQRELNKKVSGVERIISVRVAGRILEGVKSSARNPRCRSLTQKHDFRTRSIVSWYSITGSLMQTTIRGLSLSRLYSCT